MMAAYMIQAPTINEIRDARVRIRDIAHITPVLTSDTLDRLSGASLFFKCENLQKGGAFKFRGATNTVAQLSDEDAARGVATHSSGNHAQALAIAARERGIPAFIVMPKSAPAVKRAAVLGYGAEVIPCESTQVAREAMLNKVVARTGATFIHPYDDPRVVAGQGTAALELMDQAPELDLIITPIGGGGLISGTTIAVHATQPNTEVVAGEPFGADEAYRSLKSGQRLPSIEPKTIADGLLTGIGAIGFHVLTSHGIRIVRVTDEQIVDAMRLVWERMKLIIEPSAAVPLAAALGAEMEIQGKRVGIIFSGGNVDLGRLPF
jgi:threonine dehydratase